MYAKKRVAEIVRRVRRQCFLLTAAAGVGAFALLPSADLMAQGGGSGGGGAGGGAAAAGGASGGAGAGAGGAAAGRGGASGGAGARAGGAAGRGGVSGGAGGGASNGGLSGRINSRAGGNSGNRGGASADRAGGQRAGSGGSTNRDSSQRRSDSQSDFPEPETPRDARLRANNRENSGRSDQGTSQAGPFGQSSSRAGTAGRNQTGRGAAERESQNPNRLGNRGMDRVSPEEAARGVLPSEVGRQSSTGRSQQSGDSSNIRDPRETGGPTHTRDGWPLDYFGGRGPSAGSEREASPTGDRQRTDRTTERSTQRDRTARFPDDRSMNDSTSERQFSEGNTSGIRDPRETGGPTHTRDGWPLNYFGSGGNADRSQLPEPSDREDVEQIRGILGRGTGRGGSTPLDGNNNGVRDSVENYVPDPNETATPQRDTLDARDWNANTDIDPPRAQDAEMSSSEAFEDQTGLGFDEANLDPELDPAFNTQDEFPGDETTAADRSDRFFGRGLGTGAAAGGVGGATLNRNRNADGSIDGTVADERFEAGPRPRPTTADTDSGRDSRTLPQRRTARRLDLDAAAAERGLDRAADRLDRNEARITERFQNRSTRPTDRAADRLESNADRFRQRTRTEDE